MKEVYGLVFSEFRSAWRAVDQQINTKIDSYLQRHRGEVVVDTDSALDTDEGSIAVQVLLQHRCVCVCVSVYFVLDIHIHHNG